MYPITLIAAAGVLLMTGCASTGTAPVQHSADKLTNTADLTLYVFDKDSAGKSACNGDCAVKWPPLIAAVNDKASGDGVNNVWHTAKP